MVSMLSLVPPPTLQGHRRDSSLPLFAPPPIKLNQEMSLRQPVYVPASAVDMRHRPQQQGVREEGEGSSTESLAHMRELTGHSVVTGYVDHVVDSQYPEYVVIEASPKETGEEVRQYSVSCCHGDSYCHGIHQCVWPKCWCAL